MRTTIRLEDDLLRRVKARAAASGRSLNEFIVDAIRVALTPRGKPVTGKSPTLPSFRGRGLLPGVDLDDSAALLDRMEPRTASRRVAEGRRKPEG